MYQSHSSLSTCNSFRNSHSYSFSLPFYLSVSVSLSLCCSSIINSCLTLCDPWTAGFSVLHHLLELAQTHVYWVGDAIQPSHPLSPPSLPRIRVFSNESVLCIRWPKYWSFSFSISPSNEYSGLISFRIDWFDLFAVQGTLESLLEHHSSKASILQHSGFFMVQLSHPYMTTGKTTALTRWTSLVVQTVKNLPAMQETWVLSLVLKDPLEEGMATHPSILAWRIPMAEKFGGLQSMVSQRVRYNWLSD